MTDTANTAAQNEERLDQVEPVADEPVKDETVKDEPVKDETVKDERAERWEKIEQAGRTFISFRWSALAPETRAWLLESGRYDKHGRPKRRWYQTEIDAVADLEYDLGELYRCAYATFPVTRGSKSLIPREAFDSSVLFTAASILDAPPGRPDPEFLRLALAAIRQNQVANLLLDLPELTSGSQNAAAKKAARFFTGLLAVAAVAATPFLLGMVFVSAAKGELGDTVLGLYLLSFFVVAAVVQYRRAENQTKSDERAYHAWQRLGHLRGPWNLLGAGAQAYLEEMVRNGVRVPPIALDICAALRVRAQETMLQQPR